ncbi:alpha/beta hydrolase [Bradyrhizobium sp. CB3481]|uniref:alpha/beta fold hydrolase n=1 Tax=Bradyrhizobium sp. CB3481 TaxID=3039158 RepID=UPI0024B0DF33|nr:alpha/beta hydrolase [Bradyrhizobium sp. CB3481]WFU16127.1 alpha/beta hydrolase [Bradyrhizobium sp. CB3481]
MRLFFDVEGPKLVPDGPVMREKPVLLMLHGGPGADHSIYRPAYSALADIAQIVYLDHRGNGRSEDGPREAWNLAQWGDDVAAFCDTLGISSPIVLGASFGGMVALSYATRHPKHPSKLILISTEARGGSYPERRVTLFERLGGPEAGALARRRFLEPQSPWGLAERDAWLRLALPFYTRRPRDPDMARRAVNRAAVGLHWFARPGGESDRFNMLPDLDRIRCPTLVIGGEDDPMHPIESQADIAAALPAHLVQFERFADCGHGVVPDAPEQAMALIRNFVLKR